VYLGGAEGKESGGSYIGVYPPSWVDGGTVVGSTALVAVRNCLHEEIFPLLIW
jgi:hypothetical protein